MPSARHFLLRGALGLGRVSLVLIALALVVAWFVPGLMLLMIALIKHPISELVPIPALPTMLLIAAGFVFGALRVMCSLLGRRYRRAVVLAVILVAAGKVVGFTARALDRADALYRVEHFAEDVLATADLEAPLEFHESDPCAGNHVYSCSFAVFELPAALEQRFRGPGVHQPEHRPRVPQLWRPDIGAVAWHGTPMGVADAPYLDFALATDPGVSDGFVLPWAEHVRSSAARPGGYLGYLYRNRGYRPDELVTVELFLVDLETKRIFVANRRWQR